VHISFTIFEKLIKTLLPFMKESYMQHWQITAF